MIIVYTESSSKACRNALNWFKDHEIPIVERRIHSGNMLTRSEVFTLLELSQNGFEDVLSLRSIKVQELLHELDYYTVNEAVNLIVKYPELLKKPLITDGKKIYAGFNTEHIRCFIPEKIRSETLKEYYFSKENLVM
ncbi:ArsC/Spx/MgsR family protein [Enterococcus raffinosus]|uniref:ArsC/Spx/MgsR family protein n=1 Tax=Enterococcus raffinosus TaxID=71452 RepID=A0AAW8TA14_9ENTE|nr:ArsC/Spx/MgsR family protein [Enterococcus raffinosus]MDT2521998.1 ArsC/Spx/MgsR family protein [Enterococcus raffinosus]MDT2528342.1 ArsC/Spx/MgsR family protein [Enterococcus raffinosus]MDT2533192.1 ArsC/Spx/MgsR family protein [Enterococcus raffinosus]MDT2543632.1 ArsC/Spx/MgsR family protein [Enterococcus raffinosus]MDT2553746.1 ArsC/Spx/MgsR family protein [Enterococcus raffinosus]